MQYVLEYEECVRKTNSITIEVESEEKGEEIANELYGKAMGFRHPDDIKMALLGNGIKIIGTCEGTEDCSYEIL